jgi:hypothetical protein
MPVLLIFRFGIHANVSQENGECSRILACFLSTDGQGVLGIHSLTDGSVTFGREPSGKARCS